ncbi:MAG: DUF2958 domain-containing protein [Candidatus Sphingomonas phytovorans]|nr:DUF2958 domain-containing protein [Sphingomonas sp.]WEK02173.1 MAG: DUF2958 domain-containing protein [Sphingomonas sp.]
MELLTPELRAALRANADAQLEAQRTDRREPDPVPVVKFFSPLSAATWLATELDADGDTLFGLADLGFGCPELGSFSLSEIAAVRLPFGLGIERDRGFASAVPLSVWADTARHAGSILSAAQLLGPVEAHHRAQASAPPMLDDAPASLPDPLPPPDPEDG